MEVRGSDHAVGTEQVEGEVAGVPSGAGVAAASLLHKAANAQECVSVLKFSPEALHLQQQQQQFCFVFFKAESPNKLVGFRTR